MGGRLSAFSSQPWSSMARGPGQRSSLLPNQGKLRTSIRGVLFYHCLPPPLFCLHAFLFTLSSAIKSSLRNQFTASKTSSLQSVGVLGPLDWPCLASAITRSFIALGCKPVQVCLCATRTHIQSLRLFC